ncbi:MAG: polymer-forming cytoskeletal protein [Alphaproteobacteria bacterium]
MFTKTEKNDKVEKMVATPRPVGAQTMPSIIGSDMRIVGEVISQGETQLEGTVEGNVKCGNVTVGNAGTVNGEISAETVHVSGSVTGKIRAKTVTLTKSARVKGDIAHDSLSIEAGAQFEGQVSRLDQADKALRPEMPKPSVVAVKPA